MTPSRGDNLKSFLKGLGGVLVVPLGCLVAPIAIPVVLIGESLKRDRAVQAAERFHCVKCGCKTGRLGIELAEKEAAEFTKRASEAYGGRVNFGGSPVDGTAKCPNERCDARYEYIDSERDFTLVIAEKEPPPSTERTEAECEQIEAEYRRQTEDLKPAAERVGETVGCGLIGLIVLAGIGLLIYMAIFVMMNPVTS
jgi:hypothetical protein